MKRHTVHHTALDGSDRETVSEGILALEAELVAARAETESQRARYRDLFDFDPDGHLVTNKTGVIAEANLAAATMLGVSSQYLVGKPIAVYSMMEDRSTLREAINSMGRRDYAEFTVRILPRGLPMRICHIRLSSVHDELRGPLRGIRWVIRDITESRRTEEEIARTREKLRELASELSLAEERVRREIAVGIHDRVSQPLALVKILLGKMKLSADPAQSREIGELSGLVQQAIDESRTLTFELSPPVLYVLGLPAAVEWLAEQIQRRHGVNIRTQSTADAEPIRLDLRVLLFQSIRELLVNIIKHSQAKNANITLRSDRKSVQVVVSDNGVGFSRSTARSSQAEGFGLFSIRTRVERVGGQFAIDSKSGRGTRVTLMVPLEQEAVEPSGQTRDVATKVAKTPELEN